MKCWKLHIWYWPWSVHPYLELWNTIFSTQFKVITVILYWTLRVHEESGTSLLTNGSMNMQRCKPPDGFDLIQNFMQPLFSQGKAALVCSNGDISCFKNRVILTSIKELLWSCWTGTCLTKEMIAKQCNDNHCRVNGDGFEFLKNGIYYPWWIVGF